ncbi:GNAT family N-acetyltransferase [Domibacillus sp. DTU_2020_1001157_1_SI_ALB_TIR_016]|uniref:lipid II:glycine glycyltransferase FemX n=1 Tax=Domibacillus sp. DTU_2020_1001157_1_SI_ALB_TIR_016 TaxID=3077789 RepID=UPI0028E96EC2|nr:GNAT family N-acetyltransferase [Domibacillus sp. DTU_2020_1001157_1_SI_ALB_TIR_016]WNS81216.1 GNAT family N-acetyltransferase [Domibacillus sp. DTU_2020_1001157_1_SI_ALB_TIR_016]
MVFKVLGISEKDEWQAYMAKLPRADIYFTAEYCQIYENNGEGKAQLFVYEDGDACICYPYLLREIDSWMLGPDEQGTLYDITTPYGYGGPLSNIQDEQERKIHYEIFQQLFGEYCKSHNIVAEFVRFHPLIHNERDYQSVSPILNRNTVSLTLQEDEAALMDSLRNKGRNRVKYAMKQGLQVTQEGLDHLGWFAENYAKTMEKNQADSYYYFNESFFRDTIELLEGNITTFAVRYEGEVIASCMFMHYNDYVSYHLTGSKQEYLHLAPSNLLVWHAAAWFGKLGYKSLHLGGGYRDDDDLLRFKRNFTKNPLLDFYIGKKIHIPEQYERLTKGIDIAGDFFPLYRHPAVQKISV